MNDQRLFEEIFTVPGYLIGHEVAKCGVSAEAFNKLLISLSAHEEEFRCSGQIGYADLFRGVLDGMIGKRPGDFSFNGHKGSLEK